MYTIFSEKAKSIQSLWDAAELPERSGGRTKWGAKVEAVWAWKDELPETYPDDIYYGKVPGGHAALMMMIYLRETDYVKADKATFECSELAQQVYEIIRLNPNVTGELRKEAMELFGCTKSRFDAALKQVQITLSNFRSYKPGMTSDTRVLVSEVYLDLVS